jgi:hypothetical protein
MKVFYYLERIEKIHDLVTQEKTGSPEEFARRLGISRTRLYEIMDDLRYEGAPISYSKTCRTFYYEKPFHISVSFELRTLNSREKNNINGGKIFLSTFFPDAAGVILYCKLTNC